MSTLDLDSLVGTRVEVIPCSCRYCGLETRSTGTRECDRCWEVARRVRSNPELARRVLRELSKEKSK